MSLWALTQCWVTTSHHSMQAPVPVSQPEWV